ncbi:MAG: Asp-tRNA(Asn)/Glu-tRNA(Gln) amidotransferase subunit GatB [Candidatus Paceibacterota bacterium]|jgi:aspartyl-tRNA(Asn)/glutamyl-tRNA(Gln) amidotransferase subunit B
MDKKYIPIIGLEIHAELKTETKMFCRCKNDPDETRPNANICPICMGHPGTLPVINMEAVKHVLKVGIALNGELAYDFTEFDRKNYFYPDIPKGYQITQYKYPFIKGGELLGVSITRVHLEEDTASSSHDKGDYSLVDFNRAGVPLMELVTEPVITDAATASRFARELQLLLRYIGAGEANMEKGEMRVEVNVSVQEAGLWTLGEKGTGTYLWKYNGNLAEGESIPKMSAKVEVKNLNSFKALEKAVAYEIDRQISVIESGGKVVQETRGWDDGKETTFSQRAKENSHDYRYYPDPDLPKLRLSELPDFSKETLNKQMPELPWVKRERYQKDFELKPEDAEMYVRSRVWGDYFEQVIAGFSGEKKLTKLASNYLSSDLAGLIKKETTDTDAGLTVFIQKVPPAMFAKLITMASTNLISSRGAKDILAILALSGGDPEIIANEKGLIQKNDPEALKKIVENIIVANPTVVADFKAGKEAALQFLVGQGMKESKGSANPGVLKELIRELIK